MYFPDWLRRGLRTFFQAFVGVLVIEALPLAANPQLLIDVSWLQRVGLAATAAGAVALVSWLHNFLEDKGVVKAVGKAPASAGAKPVPDTRRHLERH